VQISAPLLLQLGAVLTVLAVISVQYRVQMFLLQQVKWQGVLANKLLFIVLLRQQNLELLLWQANLSPISLQITRLEV